MIRALNHNPRSYAIGCRNDTFPKIRVKLSGAVDFLATTERYFDRIP